MRSSSFLKLCGVVMLAMVIVISGSFTSMQRTAAATPDATNAATDSAVTPAPTAQPAASTPAATAQPAKTEAPTAAATAAAATSVATSAATAAATKFPPCPGTIFPTATPTLVTTPAATTEGTVAATPAITEPGFLGITARLVDNCGVRVLSVVAKGPADNAGLKVGDVIVGFNGKQIMSLSALQAWVLNSTPGTVVTLVLKRGEAELSLDVTLGTVQAVMPATATVSK